MNDLRDNQACSAAQVLHQSASTSRSRTWLRRLATSATLLGTVLLSIALMMHGCEPNESSTAGNSQPGDEDKPLRIVSFSPAITKMVVDMGLGDQLVGVAEHDDAAPDDVPVVGSIFDLNTEKLLVANPTHVLVMATATGVPQGLVDLADEGSFKLATYPYPNRVVEIRQILGCAPSDSPNHVDLGKALGRLDEAADVCNQMTQNLQAVREQTREREPRRVMMFFGTQPLMASGPGTVLDDVLTNVVNATNAAQDTNLTAPVYDREKLLAARPDVILLMMPGAPPLDEMQSDPRLASLRGLPIPAIENKRVVLLNDPLVLLPGSNIDDLAATMAEAVYPEADLNIPKGDDDKQPSRSDSVGD